MKSVIFLCALLCGQLAAAVLPPASGNVNVRERYGAKGDGVTDDTDPLQRPDKLNSYPLQQRT